MSKIRDFLPEDKLMEQKAPYHHNSATIINPIQFSTAIHSQVESSQPLSFVFVGVEEVPATGCEIGIIMPAQNSKYQPLALDLRILF